MFTSDNIQNTMQSGFQMTVASVAVVAAVNYAPKVVEMATYAAQAIEKAAQVAPQYFAMLPSVMKDINPATLTGFGVAVILLAKAVQGLQGSKHSSPLAATVSKVVAYAVSGAVLTAGAAALTAAGLSACAITLPAAAAVTGLAFAADELSGHVMNYAFGYKA